MTTTSSRTWIRPVLAVALLGLAIAVFLLRPAARDGENQAQHQAATEALLPQLIDLGADKCVPCKMMAPILEELATEKAAYFSVQFIDVWKFPEAAQPYNIRVIPTQLFLAPDGTELFRHEGFFSREEILSKWTELGYATGPA